jgi:hypothetical protein
MKPTPMAMEAVLRVVKMPTVLDPSTLNSLTTICLQPLMDHQPPLNNNPAIITKLVPRSPLPTSSTLTPILRWAVYLPPVTCTITLGPILKTTTTIRNYMEL